jgi:uncharacterized protein (UPF0305 family)
VRKIKRSRLFLKLKNDIKQYKPPIKQINLVEKDQIQNIMSEFNLENFNRLMTSKFSGEDYEIDDRLLEDFKSCIDNYFKLYGPDDIKFKEFIKIISVYLTFIEEKPLHPLGIVFEGGYTIYQSGNSYYCTGKKLFIKEDKSLCNYCVCKDI